MEHGAWGVERGAWGERLEARAAGSRRRKAADRIDLVDPSAGSGRRLPWAADWQSAILQVGKPALCQPYQPAISSELARFEFGIVNRAPCGKVHRLTGADLRIMTDSELKAEGGAEALQNLSLYKEFEAEREEILKHKWFESEKAGYDIGFERALTDWIIKHRAEWRKHRQAQRAQGAPDAKCQTQS
jgi:hypothetical protein